MRFSEARLVREDSIEELDDRFAEQVVNLLSERVRDGRVAHLALSGGSLAKRALPHVVSVANARGLDWSNVHVWFADERYLPRGHEERNASPIVAAMRDAVGFPPDHLHIPASSDSGYTLDEAAEEYAGELRRVVGLQDRARFPQFDLILLGMGPDGHTASLFPGHDEVEIQDEWVVAVRDSPKPPPERISLTFPILTAARYCWVYATGADKHDAFVLARAGAAPALESPIGHVSAVDEVAVFGDSAALGQ